MKKYISFVIFFTLTTLTLNAQRKLYGLPESYKQPIDVFGDVRNLNTTAIEDFYNTAYNKSRDKAWLVFSDRDKNPVYSSANTNSEKVSEINFKEYFFVVDEKNDWIKIANAESPNKLKANSINSIGWVPKAKMLLWNAGLVDPKTKINRKAFLLNRADDVKNVINDKKNERELIVDFLRHPLEDIKENDKSIYTRYFVFKKENGKMLLGQEADLSTLNVKTSLLGWVDSRRIKEWNTRISLEPNFKPEAFKERERKESLHFRAFGDGADVKRYVNDGDLSGLFWDKDPVKLSRKQVITDDENRIRFKPDVMRFPMFKKLEYLGVEYFDSGVVGSIKILQGGQDNISEIAWSEIKDEIGNITEATKNVNIFFLIEATDRTYSFKQSILRSIREIGNNVSLKGKNVKYGALVYRDIPEGGRITEHKRLSKNVETTTNFIANVDFSNTIDQDDYTAFYYGLDKSTRVAGFEKNAINLIIMLGAFADFKINAPRKNHAASNNPECLIEDKTQIFKDLSAMNVHLHGIQLYNNGLRSGGAYTRQLQGFILETAKFSFNKNTNQYGSLIDQLESKDTPFEFVLPTMKTPIGTTKVELMGSKPGMIALPLNNQSLSEGTLKSSLNQMVMQSVQYEDKMAEILERLGSGEELNFSSEAGFSIPSFSSGIVQHLGKLSEKINNDDVVKFTDPKLSLYAEVAIPTKLQGATYPSYSYVLFMPESDLILYREMLRRNVSQSDGSYPDKRISLFNIYINIIEEFASQEILKKKKPKDMTRGEVIAIMQGIADEGLDISTDEFNDFKIGDIRNEKKVSNQKVDELIKRFYDVQKELERITRLNTRYDFCMTSGGVNYYWLRLDQVF